MSTGTPDPADLRFAERLTAAATRIPPDVLAELAAAHEEFGWSCAAASEGQACCLGSLTTAGGRHKESAFPTPGQ